MVCLLSALPGDRVTQTPAAPSPSAPVVPTISAGSDAAPAAPTVTEPAPAEDLTGWSGGLLPRAYGVQAVPASTDEAANATEYPASTTGEIGIGQVVLSAVLVLVSLALTAVAGTTLWWTLHAWRTPSDAGGHPLHPPRRRSATCPSRSCSRPATSRRCSATPSTRWPRSDHPDYEIIVIIGHDDPETADGGRAPPRGAHPTAIRVVDRPQRAQEQAEGAQHRPSALPW